MCDTLRERTEENRKKLKVILQTVLFCGRQNVPLRGHRGDSKYLYVVDNNLGNFQELLHLIRDTGNELLSDHLAKAPHNATYRSKTVQGELIVIAAD